MLAGVLARAGYYMGSHIWPARDANPKGFFEDREVNYINERLLAGVTPRRPGGILHGVFRTRPTQWQRWLTVVAPGTQIQPRHDTAARIGREVEQVPFCLKDPRFCYTLPAWRPFLGEAAFLCIFRSPSETVASILKDCREAEYLQDLRVTRSRAFAIWTAMYRNVLEVHRTDGDWLFLHYDQVLDGSAAPQVEALLDVRGDWGFPERRLRRSAPAGRSTRESERIYLELCRLAAHGDAGSTTEASSGTVGSS